MGHEKIILGTGDPDERGWVPIQIQGGSRINSLRTEGGSSQELGKIFRRTTSATLLLCVYEERLEVSLSNCLSCYVMDWALISSGRSHPPTNFLGKF